MIADPAGEGVVVRRHERESSFLVDGPQTLAEGKRSNGLRTTTPVRLLESGRPMTAILVSHPHVAAVAQGLSAALAAHGRLAAFVTGFAVAEQGWSARFAAGAAARWPVVRNRLVGGVTPKRLRALAPVEVAARVTGALLVRAHLAVKPYDTIFLAHDAATSVVSWPVETTAIYAYEDAALWTFRRAARDGLDRIWDLPLPHYRTIDEMFRQEAARWPGAVAGPPPSEPSWKRQRKDAELALATTISVASAFTKRSVERLGLSTPIVVGPYGFPVESFVPRVRPPSGKFTVLSVGTHDLRKGTPYLLEAWRQAAIPDAELHLVGPMRLAKTFVDRYAGLFVHHPYVPKRELPVRYGAADLLAFPTLGDGFGLVIQEAMCCGTPVVTTPCGGGPECITDDVNGWLIPPRDVDALVERFRAAAADRDRVAAMGRAARSRAERWTWREAGNALVRALAA
jgi:glycosyltransferase involved in cell wall biosynthesis